ncbi:hypothetical protein NCC78_22780 [Micromonospora phytophila]|uniref:hypothetical protein n=1 Tax=Micromonospora phytophila TaxID=709888 RepID=UPI002030C139|nr:hypothetical protein [Micromonospora phytophila]MCM0677493.1 hypothetical protein [Micromonospora phytophila]
MVPPRSVALYRGAHRSPARSVSRVARDVGSLALLVVLATLFLDALLITVGLLTSVAAAVSPLRRWLHRLATPPARATPTPGR